jgi:hypothetical protein
VNAIDLPYDLGGVQAEWKPQRSEDKSWSGWLPHVDLSVSRELTRGSAEHEALWQALKRPGTLTLRTGLDLWNMFRPEVQEGSKIDYTLPPEEVTVVLQGGTRLDLNTSTNLPFACVDAYAGGTGGGTPARRAGASLVASALGAEDGWGKPAPGPAFSINSGEFQD